MSINATILGEAISFVLFVMFCMKYIWPPITLAVEKRQREISEGLACAERAKKDLYLTQMNITKQLKKAQESAQLILEQASKQSIQILDEAKVEAERSRNRIIEQAKIEIDIQSKCMREELRNVMAVLIINAVEKIIKRSVSESDNKDIIDKIINEL